MFKALKNRLTDRRKMKVDKIKDVLLEEKQKIEEQLKKLTNNLNPDEDLSHSDFGRNEDNDSDVEADAFEEIGNNLAIYQVLEKELKKINESLENISKGTYGDCENCHKPIPLARLKISPSSKYCTKCIKQMEGR